ncbi:hypothetical protein LOAG_15307, partial [Loa loa]
VRVYSYRLIPSSLVGFLTSIAKERKVIKSNAHIINYLTSGLQMVEIPTTDKLCDLKGQWKQPDIFIGVNYCFKFIWLKKSQQLNSKISLFHINVSVMIGRCGDIEPA